MLDRVFIQVVLTKGRRKPMLMPPLAILFYCLPLVGQERTANLLNAEFLSDVCWDRILMNEDIHSATLRIVVRYIPNALVST